MAICLSSCGRLACSSSFGLVDYIAVVFSPLDRSTLCDWVADELRAGQRLSDSGRDEYYREAIIRMVRQPKPGNVALVTAVEVPTTVVCRDTALAAAPGSLHVGSIAAQAIQQAR